MRGTRTSSLVLPRSMLTMKRTMMSILVSQSLMASMMVRMYCGENPVVSYKGIPLRSAATLTGPYTS